MVRWQLSQDAVVGTWFGVLPFAVVPLWQVAQVPGVTPEWLNVAGVQPVVRWQLSQDAVVGTWVGVLPFAVVPLWQVAQVPGVTPVWLNVAGVQPVVRWQLSQDAVVGTWFGVLPFARSCRCGTSRRCPASPPAWSNDAPRPGAWCGGSVAGRRRRDVRRGLAGRLRAVVAARRNRPGWHAEVIEASAGEA